MGGAYYNDNDRGCADQLLDAIEARLIPDGDVDERSIVDLRPEDLSGYTQCHFFAGNGGWPYALRRARWPDDRPVWTGSCPCQPFSTSGLRRGFADSRHLWPAWFRLIGELRPDTLFGEQSANAGAWLDLVSADLEDIGYAFAAPDLPAAGFGGFHIRQRLFWVADAHNAEWWSDRAPRNIGDWAPTGWDKGASHIGECSPADWIRRSDGRLLPVEAGTRPMAPEAPGRVRLMRGYGNGLDSETAVNLVAAFLDAAP